jgi:multiple sugar transport system ATP-binding protein
MQRVAIGRALVRRPKAMLMDEPIGALDAKLRESMRTELKRLHIENGSTTVYVTHDQIEAMSLADRVAIMNEGVLQQVGTPTEVYLRPGNLFVAQFIGSPVMNVFPARMRQDGGETRIMLADHETGFPFRGPLPEHGDTSRDFMLGVRPEAVMISLAAQPGFEPIEAHIIEPLGAYDIVDLKLGSQFLRARTPSGYVAGPGTIVWARLDEPQTHFFDISTGLALTRRESH